MRDPLRTTPATLRRSPVTGRSRTRRHLFRTTPFPLQSNSRRHHRTLSRQPCAPCSKPHSQLIDTTDRPITDREPNLRCQHHGTGCIRIAGYYARRLSEPDSVETVDGRCSSLRWQRGSWWRGTRCGTQPVATAFVARLMGVSPSGPTASVAVRPAPRLYTDQAMRSSLERERPRRYRRKRSGRISRSASAPRSSTSPHRRRT